MFTDKFLHWKVIKPEVNRTTLSKKQTIRCPLLGVVLKNSQICIFNHSFWTVFIQSLELITPHVQTLPYKHSHPVAQFNYHCHPKRDFWKSVKSFFFFIIIVFLWNVSSKYSHFFLNPINSSVVFTWCANRQDTKILQIFDKCYLSELQMVDSCYVNVFRTPDRFLRKYF